MTTLLQKLKTLFTSPMFLVMVLTLITYFLLQYLRIPNNGSTFDLTLFYFIAAVSWLSALFMIIRTTWDGWTILGSGLVSHFFAVALVYFLSAWYATHVSDSYTPELVMLARSLLVVSGIFVLAGVLKEWTANTRHSARYWLNRAKQKWKFWR